VIRMGSRMRQILLRSYRKACEVSEKQAGNPLGSRPL